MNSGQKSGLIGFWIQSFFDTRLATEQGGASAWTLDEFTPSSGTAGSRLTGGIGSRLTLTDSGANS